MNNFESDPEEFARNFCKDMGIEDPEVGVIQSNYYIHYFHMCSQLVNDLSVHLTFTCENSLRKTIDS